MATKPAPIKPGDVHVVVNDWESRWIGEAKCYSDQGKLLWTIPALCKGVEGPRWSVRNANEPQNIWNAYGLHCIDLIEQENQEARYSRGGICWHGGGSGAADPMAPLQQLVPTLGCVRSHNLDLAKLVVPLLESLIQKGSRMWITVNQHE